MKLDRENDSVYRDTMNVVKAVLQSNQEVMGSKPDEIFVLVKVSLFSERLCFTFGSVNADIDAEFLEINGLIEFFFYFRISALL